MTPPAPARLRVHALTKRYGGVIGIEDLSFAVAPGEVFGLLGPNGAGKTTALECLSGLRVPDAGTVEIAGLDAARQPLEIRRRLGVQLQHATLPSQIRPGEALELFASFHAVPRDPVALLRQFDLEPLSGRAFGNLSGGERQRLFLALALVNDPALVILDEPTAGLDPAARRELQQLIRSLRADGRSVVLSTHDLEEAERLCDRVAILDRGRIIASGTPAELMAVAGLSSRLRVRVKESMMAIRLRESLGPCASSAGDHVVSIATNDLAAMLAELSRQMASSQVEIEALDFGPASLQDVYFRLTGRTWMAEGGEQRDGR